MSDRVLPEDHAAVMRRDGRCVAALLDKSHVCKDRWAHEHAPTAMGRLTVEPVKDEPMLGNEAASDPWHMVVLCHWGNAVEHWGSANRELLHAYLLGCRRPEPRVTVMDAVTLVRSGIRGLLAAAGPQEAEPGVVEVEAARSVLPAHLEAEALEGVAVGAHRAPPHIREEVTDELVGEEREAFPVGQGADGVLRHPAFAIDLRGAEARDTPDATAVTRRTIAGAT